MRCAADVHSSGVLKVDGNAGNKAAPLQLDHQGWRSLYLVKRDTGRLTVVHHSPFGNTHNSVWKHAKR